MVCGVVFVQHGACSGQVGLTQREKIAILTVIGVAAEAESARSSTVRVTGTTFLILIVGQNFPGVA